MSAKHSNMDAASTITSSSAASSGGGSVTGPAGGGSGAAVNGAGAASEKPPRADSIERVFCEEDFLVMQLITWFSTEFFTWFDQPAHCLLCGETHFNLLPLDNPTAEEAKYALSS